MTIAVCDPMNTSISACGRPKKKRIIQIFLMMMMMMILLVTSALGEPTDPRRTFCDTICHSAKRNRVERYARYTICHSFPSLSSLSYLPPQPRSWVLEIMGCSVENPEPWKILPLKPGVGQNIHALPMNFFLSNFYFSVHSTFFPKKLRGNWSGVAAGKAFKATF